MATTALLVVAGTVTTGSGPHAGDSSEVRRMPFDWATVTVAHGVLAAAVLVLAVRLLAVLPREGYRAARRTTALFVAVLVAQGAVGVFQSRTGLPELAVILHLLGSALVWVGVLRVHLTLRAADTVRPGLYVGAVRRETVGGAAAVDADSDERQAVRVDGFDIGEVGDALHSAAARADVRAADPAGGAGVAGEFLADHGHQPSLDTGGGVPHEPSDERMPFVAVGIVVVAHRGLAHLGATWVDRYSGPVPLWMGLPAKPRRLGWPRPPGRR